MKFFIISVIVIYKQVKSRKFDKIYPHEIKQNRKPLTRQNLFLKEITKNAPDRSPHNHFHEEFAKWVTNSVNNMI